MTDKRCGTCKFWGRAADAGNKYRPCLAVIQGCVMGHCPPERGGHSEDVTAEELQSQLAVVVDGSGYYAALKVREDFGCVLHQEKETT